MKKAVLLMIMALFFVVACGDDESAVGTAKITVNGVNFDKSIACSTTITNDILAISVSAIDNSGNTIGLSANISKDGSDYKFIDGDSYGINYSEGIIGSYLADDEGSGTFSASFKGGVVKASFDVDALLNGMGTIKNLKGEIECTPGGATN
jgi:hypothetical protein